MFYDVLAKIASVLLLVIGIPTALVLFVLLLSVVFIVAAVLSVGFALYSIPVALYQSVFSKQS